MTTLLYKEFRLVCHPMTPLFALFGLMVFIPNYPYTVIFFYVMLGLFFTFLNKREQRDLYYTALLPVRKRDTVKASCRLVLLIELASLVVLVPCCILSAHLWPEKDNLVGLDANAALLAAGFLLYTVFNAVFLPAFYKTGYKVGASFVKALIPTTAGMVVLEALPHFPALLWLNNTTWAGNLRQLPLLLGSMMLFAGMTVFTVSAAEKRYEQVDL